MVGSFGGWNTGNDSQEVERLCRYKAVLYLVDTVHTSQTTPFLLPRLHSPIKMRFSHLSVFALSGLAIASPVVTKRADAVSLLTDLYATVQTYTGAISQSHPPDHINIALLTDIDATLAPLSVDSSLLEKTAATLEVGTQINRITSAISATTNDINALPPAADTASVEPVEKRQIGLTVGVLLSLIIVEIFATVGAAIGILGLGGLLIFLNPLTSALSLLIVTLQVVLNIVLLDVIVLLNALLTSLALGVSGL
jgi:hypothetical protein